MSATELLFEHLREQLSASATDWLETNRQQLLQTRDKRLLQRLFSSAPRWLPRDSFQYQSMVAKLPDTFAEARFDHWTKDQAGRVAFLASFPYETSKEALATIQDLFDTADLRETEAIYLSLPFLPFPEAFVRFAAEGIRTNMVSVFDAVALGNPYPADYLDEAAWNQLYLKAAFMARPLYRIVGIERRANAELSRMIQDYAEERWAAGRLVSPEIWRAATHFLNDSLVESLERLASSDLPLERAAAALVCRDAEYSGVKSLKRKYPDLKKPHPDSWEGIGKALDAAPLPEKK